LHMPEVRKLAVFDINEAKIVHQIPLAEENVLFTAGLDKLIVVFPDKNLLQRWSLTTGQRETSGVLQSRGTVKRIVLGSGSNGPLLLVTDERGVGAYGMLELKTFKQQAYRQPATGRVDLGSAFIRASTNGRVFSWWQPEVSPQGINSLVISGLD